MLDRRLGVNRGLVHRFQDDVQLGGRTHFHVAVIVQRKAVAGCVGRAESNQLAYSLLARAIEYEIVPRCVETEPLPRPGSPPATCGCSRRSAGGMLMSAPWARQPSLVQRH